MAQHLVNAFAAVKSTEELILFVAGTDNMLNFCQDLLVAYDRDSRAPLAREVNSLCRAQAILPGILYSELRKILLALNRFHDASRDHYAVLGLTPAATREEVRQAYRSLSKQYHPDRLRDSDESAQRFMEIAGAYHAIMGATAQRQAESQTPWREQRLPRPGRRPPGQRIFFLAIAGMICMLAGASIYLAGRYNTQMIISQLRMDRSSPQNIAKQKIAEDAFDAPQTRAAERPSAHDGIQADNVEQPKEEHGISTPGNRQSADNDSTPLQPLASPVSLEPFAQENNLLPETRPFHRMKLTDSPSEVSTSPQTRKDEKKLVPLPAQGLKQSESKHLAPEPEKAAEVNKHLNQQPPTVQPVIVSEKILALINQYSSLYCRRELPPFLALFSEDATENGTPLPGLTDQYRSLFARTRTIDLHIMNMNWSEQQEGIHARGNFRSSYTYDDGRTREHHGDISFFLIDDHGKLKIKALDYVFQE